MSNYKPKNGLQLFISLIGSVILGLAIGFLAKYSDTISGDGSLFSGMMQTVSQLTTAVGIWIFIGCLLAAWSRSAPIAAVKVGLFFGGMFASSYGYQYYVYHFFPFKQFIFWLIMAVIAIFGSIFVWKGRYHYGWVAALGVALPVALFILIGKSFFYTFHWLECLNLIFGILLLVLIPKSKDWRQYLQILFLTVVFCAVGWLIPLPI